MSRKILGGRTRRIVQFYVGQRGRQFRHFGLATLFYSKEYRGKKKERGKAPLRRLSKNPKRKPTDKVTDGNEDPDSIEEYINDPKAETPPPSKSAGERDERAVHS